MLCTEGDQNLAPRLWLRSGRSKKERQRQVQVGRLEAEPISEKTSELLPDRQNPIGGQGGCGARGIEKACRRETVLSSGCID